LIAPSLLRGNSSKLAAVPPPQPEVDDNAEFIAVLEVHDSFALRLATATLEEAGISFMIVGEQPRDVTGLLGGSLCKCHSVIQVAREDENEARELLAPIENPEPTLPAE